MPQDAIGVFKFCPKVGRQKSSDLLPGGTCRGDSCEPTDLLFQCPSPLRGQNISVELNTYFPDTILPIFFDKPLAGYTVRIYQERLIPAVYLLFSPLF